MQTVNLREHPEWMESFAEFHAREWSHLYPHWNQESALADFQSQRGDGTLPTTLVLVNGQTPLGSVSLIFDDLPTRPDLNPWLASLYIRPEFRGQGHAQRLIAEASGAFVSNGFSRFYLFTETRVAYFARQGFRPIEQSQLNGHSITLMQNS